MSITITVPDSVVKAAQAEADASGATVEQYLLATLAERFAHGSSDDAPITHTNPKDSPLLRLIGLAKDGPTDSSVYHDYRPGDPT